MRVANKIYDQLAGPSAPSFEYRIDAAESRVLTASDSRREPVPRARKPRMRRKAR